MVRNAKSHEVMTGSSKVLNTAADIEIYIGWNSERQIFFEISHSITPTARSTATRLDGNSISAVFIE